MTFREKNAALALATLVLVYGAYTVWLLRGPHTQAQTLAVVVGGVIVAVIISVALAVPVAIYSALRRERNEPGDERDRQIGQKSSRNAYWVVLATIWVVPVAALTASPVLTANVALLILGVAEISNYASRLYYYRWGA